MAFSDYKGISQVQAEFLIKYQEENFIAPQEYDIPKTFIEEFTFNQKNLDVFSSEASRCEIIIFPILREVYKNIIKRFHYGCKSQSLTMKSLMELLTI